MWGLKKVSPLFIIFFYNYFIKQYYNITINYNYLQNASVHYWLDNGAPAEKIVLGVPFYGKSFTLVNETNNKVGDATSSGGTAGPYTGEVGTLGYNEICEMRIQGGWTLVYQKDQEAPYTYKGNQWVGFDGPW